MAEIGIRSVGFAPGSETVWYRDLEGIEEAIAESEIPDEEDLWGWGNCRRSPGGYRAHVADGFGELVGELAAGLTGEAPAVDAVIGCGPFQNEAAELAAALESEGVLEPVGGMDRLHLLEGYECVNVFQALQEARARIRAGAENVLILASEKAERDVDRFRPWCFFSDFCLALLVSGRPERCRFTVGDVAVCPDPDPADDGSRVFGRDLEAECIAALLAANGLTLAEVERFFYMNLFEPIATMKGTEIGFDRSQLYTELSRELGHCYGADPFINLQSFCAERAEGGPYVLCASDRQSAGVAIVHHRRDDPC